MSPRGDAKPGGLVLQRAILQLDFAVDGDAKTGDGDAAGGVTHVRVGTEVTDDRDLLPHRSVSFPVVMCSIQSGPSATVAATCIVGETAIRKLFGGQEALGEKIRLQKLSCEVIGLLAAKGQSTMGTDQDDIVVIPLSTFQRRIAGNQDVGFIQVSVEEGVATEKVQNDIVRLLRERRHLALEGGDERAMLAQNMECYRLKKYFGSYIAAIGPIDAIIFTAGVGEFAPAVREKACAGLEHLGIKLDSKKNWTARTKNAETIISADDSKIKIMVIPTDEELVMTEDAYALMAGTYDVHTRFTYSFQNPSYVNKARAEGLKKDLETNPELASIIIR